MRQLRNNVESGGVLRILQCGKVGIKKVVPERRQKGKGWSKNRNQNF